MNKLASRFIKPEVTKNLKTGGKFFAKLDIQNLKTEGKSFAKLDTSLDSDIGIELMLILASKL